MPFEISKSYEHESVLFSMNWKHSANYSRPKRLWLIYRKNRSQSLTYFTRFLHGGGSSKKLST